MKRWIALAAAAVAVAVVLVIAGVGGSGTDTVPRSTIADAAAATSRTGYRIAMDATVTVADEKQPIRMKGSGVIDPRGNRGRLTLSVNGIEIEQVFAKFVFYMRSELFRATLPDGKSWVKMDLDKVGRQMGFDVTQMGGGDPSQTLDQLRAVSGDVERLGDERVRGVATTRYRGTVDVRRYPRLVPPARREQVRRGVERIRELTGLTRFPQEVWIGRDGRVRRVAFEYGFRPAPLGGKKTATMKMRMDLYDFGVDVDAEIPPADRVADITALRGAARANQ